MAQIVILGTRSKTTYILINHLLKKFEVGLVIFENMPSRSKLAILQHRRERLGSWYVAQQILFLIWDRLYIRPVSRRRISELLEGENIEAPDGRIKSLDVPNINAPEVVQLVRDILPPCGVVSGTSLLRRPLIESIPIWLNIHCGITPRYRGVHGAFWAIYEGCPDMSGVTVHKIDQGTDTGGIVAQDVIETDASDTYRTLPAKQYLKGVPLMVDAVKAALDGRLTTYHRTDIDSKIWYSPTLSEYLKFQRKLKILARK